ncbi:MAG: hypothetical protein QXM31_01515 [Candidatus Woesearchaeota archaeon]
MIGLRKFLWLAVAVVLCTAAFAQDFAVEFAPPQQSIGQNERAEYNVTIFHDYKNIEFFEIYSPEVLWDIRTKDPLHVKPLKPFFTTLSIQPLNINPGLYGVPIHVKRTGTNQVKKAMLYMEVTGPPATHTYMPAVRGTVEIPAFVDPRDEVIITVNLENQNRRNLSELSIKVRSNVINKDYTISLGPLERRIVRLIARIDPKTHPQRDTLHVTVVATEKDKGFQFDLPPVDYEVASYGQLAPTVEVIKSFLKTVRIITLVNDANVLLEQPFAYPMPWYARIFTKSEPKSRIEDGRLVWDVKLNVGNSMELRVTTNYRPLAIIIALAIIIYLAYLVFRSPLAIKKSATVLSTREGGISELKILLELKNRTNKALSSVTLIDLVPRIAELLKEYDVGTLTPSSVIRHERKGTIIKYNVGDIMPREERVISYQVKSSLSILGGVSLPEAVSKFTTSTGKERTTNSNRPKVKFLG